MTELPSPSTTSSCGPRGNDMCDAHDDVEFRASATPPVHRGLSRRTLLKGGAALGVAARAPALFGGPWFARADALPTGGTWFRADLHCHCTFSSDASADVAVLADQARLSGYHALFLTDHDGASSFVISGESAQTKFFRDSLAGGWTATTYGSPTSSTCDLVTSPVIQGTASLHLQAVTSSYGERFICPRRGPTFLNGPFSLDFKVYPTRIDPGCGAYVSISLGGDPTTGMRAEGYARQDGTVTRTNHFVFVWALGNITNPDWPAGATVTRLPYTLNQWNTYHVDASSVILGALATADQPASHVGMTYLKMATGGSGGTADVYLDDLALTTSTPRRPG